MKKLILLFALIFLIGCAGVKKTTVSELKSDVKTETEVKKNTEVKETGSAATKTEKNADVQQKKNTSIAENDIEETTIHTILYDPKSKVDSLTNRQMIVSETIQKSVKSKNKKEVVSTETLYSANEVTELFSQYFKSYNSKTDSLQKENISLKSEVTTKTEQVNNWWKWLLVGIFIPVIVYYIIRFKWYNILSFIWKKYN